jgi:hypothetical protein
MGYKMIHAIKQMFLPNVVNPLTGSFKIACVLASMLLALCLSWMSTAVAAGDDLDGLLDEALSDDAPSSTPTYAPRRPSQPIQQPTYNRPKPVTRSAPSSSNNTQVKQPTQRPSSSTFAPEQNSNVPSYYANPNGVNPDELDPNQAFYYMLQQNHLERERVKAEIKAYSLELDKKLAENMAQAEADAEAARNPEPQQTVAVPQDQIQFPDLNIKGFKYAISRSYPIKTTIPSDHQFFNLKISFNSENPAGPMAMGQLTQSLISQGWRLHHMHNDSVDYETGDMVLFSQYVGFVPKK